MQKIQIRNFFAIQEAEFEIDKVLLLIGEQASGKSTVSKLIYFFKSLRLDFLTEIYQHITDNDNTGLDTVKLRGSIWQKIRTKFYQYFGSTKHLPDFTIRYFYSENKSVQLDLHSDKRVKIELNATLFDVIFRNNKLSNLIQRVIELRTSKNDFFEEMAFSSLIKEIEQFINDVFEDHRVPFFIPASRNLTVSFSEQLKFLFFGNLSGDIRILENELTQGNLEQNPPPASLSQSVDLYLISEFLKHTEKIQARFRNQTFASLLQSSVAPNHQKEASLRQLALEKVTQILKAEYRLEGRYEKLYYAVDENRYVDLNDASSGQQESIRILQDLFMILLDRASVFRVIEEPEAHLYPMAQKHLIELIALTLNFTDSQVVITTHSPYILSVFNNLLYAKRVAKINPAAYEEIEKKIPAVSWLDPATFRAYSLKSGQAQSIVNQETDLIDQNFLDEISEELGDEFNTLYSIHAEAI